jgi:3-methyl-2-oxobutanoate hydroxymethyltransferase
MMALHTAAVRRGAPGKFLVGDMPFLSFRKGIVPALECVNLLMKAGANAVKLEGVRGHEDVVSAIVGSGVPVMGHLGLTPQSVNAFGGFRVQAREAAAAAALVKDAHLLQELGCFAVVLECVPAKIAARVSDELRLPTIGIGAGPDCDGQVLVLPDMLGMDTGLRPKFVRAFAQGEEIVTKAAAAYVRAVRDGSFPSPEESYS